MDTKAGGSLKPLFDGLFGRQREALYEREHFVIRELSDMLFDLSKIPLSGWDAYAFLAEPLRGKVSDEKRAVYMKEAWECGAEWADRYKGEYGSLPAEALAARLGMEVSYPELPESTDRVLFAEFREPCHIRIYTDAINRVESLLYEERIRTVLGEEDISDILLLHELFHSIEEKHKKEIYTRTEMIGLWQIGPFQYKSGLVALSEIAAMAFAYRYSDIGFIPYLLDVVLVYGYSKEEASGLYEKMMNLAGQVKGEDNEC